MDAVRDGLGLERRQRFTGAGVVVAVIDTGIDTTHAAFPSDAFAAAPRRFAGRGPVDDRDGHGTHVAGIIAGRPDPQTGRYAGVAPDARLLVYQVDDAEGAWPLDAVAAAILQAVRDGAHIINLSMGMRELGWWQSAIHLPAPPWVWVGEDAVEKALRMADARGVLCVVAAGNDRLRGPRRGTIYRTAGSDAALSVGAVQGGELWPMLEGSSARGPYRGFPDAPLETMPRRYDRERHAACVVRDKPDVAAVGNAIWAPLASGAARTPDDVRQLARRASLGGRYLARSGTSQATAVVSGLAACVLQQLREPDPQRVWKPDVLRDLLRKSAQRLGPRLVGDVPDRVIHWSVLERNAETLLTHGALG